MDWIVKFSKKANKNLNKLDKPIKKRIDSFILKLKKSPHPRRYGEALKNGLKYFWRYRVGDYRLICSIEDDILTVLVVRLDHRKEVYKNNP